MKKYLRLTCTICKRSIDKLVDLTHYAPDQCTITLGCEGRLQPIEYLSSGGIAVAPEVGVTDWRPRGTTLTAEPSLTGAELIALETGALKQITLAAPVNQAAYALTLNVKADTPKAYRQYVYRKVGPFTTISGIESGLEKKALRFATAGANPDLVQVFLNGVELERVTDYNIYDGISTTYAPNTITFVNSVNQPGTAQVDVIVSKEAATSTVVLNFTRSFLDDSRVGKGAYENIDYADRFMSGAFVRYYLYRLDLDSANIPLNSILVPPADIDAMLLLARRPYTQLDRYNDIILPLMGLSEERDYIKYYAENKVTTLRVTSTALSTIFPALRWGKFVVENTIQVATTGVTEQLVVDGKVITGPDA